MLNRAMNAVARLDAEIAREVPGRDDEVDTLFQGIYRQLVRFGAEHPDALEDAGHLEWAAHNLERAADRVINICAWVIYVASGHFYEMDSEYEAPSAPVGA